MESQSAAAGGGSANTAKDYQQQRQEQVFFTNFNDYWVRVYAVRNFCSPYVFPDYSMLTEDIGKISAA